MGEEDKKEKHTKHTSRFIFASVALLAIFALYVVRLADWQIKNSSKWLQEANRSSTDTVEMDAARGEILDCKGNGLAINQTGYAIQFNAATVSEKTENQTIIALIRLLNSRNEKWEDKLPIRINSSGKYEFIPGGDASIAYLKSKDCLHVNSYATADQCMENLEDKYKCKGYSAKDTRDIISVRYNMTKSGFSVSLPYTFASGVSQDTIAIISENSARLPGIEVKVTAVRQYPYGSLMPQILGSVGSISKEKYDKYHDSKGYALNARVGNSGVEEAFEDYLRGKSGQETVKFDSNGKLASETVTTQPTAGNSVFLTIDSNLQKVANASLAENVRGARTNGRGYDCVAGAAVVIRVKDFAVLAASTYPSYDQNELSKNPDYYGKLLKDSAHPLLNRAFDGAFTPGSCFKPSVALAALQTGKITNATTIHCTGMFVLGDLHLRDPNASGDISMRTAMAKSSNMFFCTVAYRTGITAMNLYAKRLGLGQETGVEVGESPGTLAGPDERKAAGGTWTAGDTAQAGIGQSDNMLTPIQLATYCATIANNGTRLKTHLLDKVADYSRRKTVYTPPATKVDSIGVSQQNISYVKEAMRAVATEGTARHVFSSYGVPVAGKTGTGQTGNGADNVSFIGFAPYDHPQIAIAVVLEHGATSSYSNAVAKDLFDAYFYGKTVDSNGNIVAPSTTVKTTPSQQNAG